MYLNDDEKTVRAMDVLLPRVGEIIGGSQRSRYDVLLERIKSHHLDPKDYYGLIRANMERSPWWIWIGSERLICI